MFAENRKISLRQLQAMLLLDFFGTAALFLPGEMADLAGQKANETPLESKDSR